VTIAPRAAPAAATSTTPTLRQSGRRAAFWVVAGVVLLAVAIVTLVATGARTGDGSLTLSTDDAAPGGARAVAQVLGDQGVDVRTADTLDGALDAVEGAPGAVTVLVYDRDAFLGGDDAARLADAADRVVLVDGSGEVLESLLPGTDGSPDAVDGDAADDVVDADCDLPEAERAGGITAGAARYSGGTAELCFDGALAVSDAGPFVAALASPELLSNGSVGDAGNAALALGLLGATDTLVWYLPSADDLTDAPTVAELTPGWLTPAIGLLALAAAAAGIWRGRRMGPLVVEDLPVTVPASETMDGRARLYESSSSRLRALDALRMGAVARIARALGLSAATGVDDVVLGAAAALGRDPASVRAVLLDADPATDADLVRLSDELLDLESAIRRATTP